MVAYKRTQQEGFNITLGSCTRLNGPEAHLSPSAVAEQHVHRVPHTKLQLEHSSHTLLQTATSCHSL